MQEINQIMMHFVENYRDYSETVKIDHDPLIMLPGQEFEIDQSESVLKSGDSKFGDPRQSLPIVPC